MDRDNNDAALAHQAELERRWLDEDGDYHRWLDRLDSHPRLMLFPPFSRRIRFRMWLHNFVHRCLAFGRSVIGTSRSSSKRGSTRDKH